MCEHKNYSTIGYNRHTDQYLNECSDCGFMWHGKSLRDE